MQYCDTIFFLDYPLDVCIDGVKSGKGKTRTDMPCISLDDEDKEFMEFINSYNPVSRPKVTELLRKYSLIIFSDRNAANEFLSLYYQGIRGLSR